MTAKLPGLQKHQRTGMYWIRRVVPPDLRDIIGRREITRTLETKDPREAKRRYPAVAAIIEEIFDQARAQLASTTYYQQQFEAGDELADKQAAFEASLTLPQRKLLYRIEHQAARGKPVEIGADEMETLIGLPDEALPATLDVAPKVGLKGKASSLTLDGLLDIWAMDTQAAPKTAYAWGKIIGKLERWLRDNGKSRSAEKVTRKNIIGWRGHLLQIEKLSPKTVQDNLARCGSSITTL